MSNAPAPVASGQSEPKILATLAAGTAKISAYVQTFPQGANANAFESWLDGLNDFAWRLGD